MKIWNKPTFAYCCQTTLRMLLSVFLEANGRDKASLARDIGCSIDQIESWLRNDFTIGLTTKYKSQFEQVTGIDLECLYVIRAKNEILEMLSQIDGVRRDDPLLARLLERTSDLKDRIDFDTLKTRDEVIDILHRTASVCGYPLVALQIGVDDRQVAKWGEGYRPSGETLIRAIIAVCSGLKEGDPDNVRFLLLAEAIFGCDPKLVGISSFTQAIDIVFEGVRDDPQSTIANRTGLQRNRVASLLSYKPDGGKTTVSTMVIVLRNIIKKHHPDKLAAFDDATEEAERAFGDKNKRLLQIVVSKPLFGRSGPEGQQTSPSPRPVAQPAPVRTSATPQPQQTATTKVIQLLSELLGHQIAQLENQRKLLEVIVNGAEIQPAPIKETPRYYDGLRNLVHSKPKELAGSEVAKIVELIDLLVNVLRMICNIKPEQRDEILRTLDPYLVSMRHLFDAAGLENPAEYLKLLDQDRAAGKVISG